jgi:SAM-dependent methyltransferase
MAQEYETFGLTVGDTINGHCPAHEGPATFDVTSLWLRDGLICRECGTIPRSRAVSLVLDTVEPAWRERRIWELAPSGRASDRLCEQCPGYVGSHFWPDLAPGAERWGYVCQNVEATTFDDGQFDIVVSQDVFEHVFDVRQGMREISRVLRAGGVHVFTVPRQRQLSASRPRAERTSWGVTYLEPAEYHGSPIDDSGSLVTFDWGIDLETVIEEASGLRTTSVRLESRSYGILGEFLEVFVSRKHLVAAPSPIRHRPDTQPTGGIRI